MLKNSGNVKLIDTQGCFCEKSVVSLRSRFG